MEYPQFWRTTNLQILTAAKSRHPLVIAKVLANCPIVIYALFIVHRPVRFPFNPPPDESSGEESVDLFDGIEMEDYVDPPKGDSPQRHTLSEYH